MKFVSLCFVLSSMLILTPLATRAAENLSAGERAKTLIIGRITADPKKHHIKLERMANYLAGNLSLAGIVKGDVLIARNLYQMKEYLATGRIDLLSETALAAITLRQHTGAEIILHEWKRGVPFYQTVFFSKKIAALNR